MTSLIHNRHIAFDIETLDTRAESKIVSIGAAVFGPAVKGQPVIGNVFYSVCGLQSQKHRSSSIDTLDWWETQTGAARRALDEAGADDAPPLPDVLQSLAQFIANHTGDDFTVWGYGATFDNAILSHAYKDSLMAQPWEYRRDRCLRTLRAMFPSCPIPTTNDSPHHAGSDATLQAHQASLLLELVSRFQPGN